MPPLFTKYQCKLVEQKKRLSDRRSVVYFEDLNSDGREERIESFQQSVDTFQFSFQYYSYNGGMIDQVNLPGNFHMDTHHLFFADYDKDGNKEVYHFYFEKDSLYLSWIQLFPEAGKINTLAICKIYTYNKGLIDYQFDEVHCRDLDNDGQNELIFAVVGGYSIIPRQIFKVDLVQRKVTGSENTGCANARLSFYDLDNDGKLEVIAEGQVAPIRAVPNLKYNNQAPYLKVFDADLNYFFPPHKFFEGIQSNTTTFVVEEESDIKLLSVFASRSANCVPFRAYIFDLNGNRIDSLDYDKADRNVIKFVFQNQSGNCVIQVHPSELLEFSGELEIVNMHKLAIYRNLSYLFQADINKDGVWEVFFYDAEDKVVHLYSDSYKWHIPIQLHDDLFVAEKDLGLRNKQFYIHTKSGYSVYTFSNNSIYYLKLPIWAGIYFLSVLLLFLFQKIIESRIREKYEMQNQIRELQLKSFKNQLEPHFLFNTFNTVASVIKQGKTDVAYDIFMKLTRLLRSSLENTDASLWMLESEIKLVENYLEIQNFRFKDLFEYRVNISGKVILKVMIPKMIIQVHVENAINHGLRPKGGGGMLAVDIHTDNLVLNIEITDNGVGRERAKELKTGNFGLGIKTISQFIETHNQHSSNKISQKIIDLIDENGNPSGTKVKIVLSV